MRHRPRRVIGVILLLLLLSAHGGFPFVAWSFEPGGVVFPGIEERMNIIAVGVVLLGGLIFLLNRLRQEADRRSVENNK